MASEAVPTPRPEHLWRLPLRPGDPNYCQAGPQPPGSVRGGGGHIQSSFLGLEKLSTQFLPPGLAPADHFLWLRLLWAPAHLSTMGFLSGLLRGTESGQEGNRSRAAEMGLRFRVRTVTLWA